MCSTVTTSNILKKWLLEWYFPIVDAEGNYGGLVMGWSYSLSIEFSICTNHYVLSLVFSKPLNKSINLLNLYAPSHERKSFRGGYFY